MIQPFLKRDESDNLNRYINITRWHDDMNCDDVGSYDVVRQLSDDLSTALIGSLVHLSKTRDIDELQSLYIQMLNHVKGNLYQVSQDLAHSIK